MNNDTSPCDQARELIPEIAAGAAAGDERAYALRHLSSCARCRTELGETAETVDELLALAPERKPPAGFEAAVLERIVPRQTRRKVLPGWLHGVVVAAAAGLAATAVWLWTTDDRELAATHRRTLSIAQGKALTAARLVAGNAEIGTVFAYEGRPSWFYVTFRRPPPPGRYTVALVTRDGRRTPLRDLEARPETTGWGSRGTFRIGDLEALEFHGSTPSGVMTARFD